MVVRMCYCHGKGGEGRIDSVWGWSSPPLRLHLVHPRSRMGEMVIGERPPSPARLPHTSEKHPRVTLGELNVLRRHRELCDVVLNVGSRKIFAHRVILSACSPYFRAMFTGELAESRQTEVTIRDIDEVAMDLLIDFCYTSHIVVEEANVQTLLPAGLFNVFTDKCMRDACENAVGVQLDNVNVRVLLYVDDALLMAENEGDL
uniref:BTB domain-containing protein n=1 Tax=Timema poppense TaxID=170557 RepID=A0A7R9CJ47_TIMPO|nr:unnamed protein product [Timema poppensis]